jgi:hypothetical protein
MAIPFLNNINLSDNELQNAKLHVTSTAPTAAAAQIYFNSTPSDLTAKYYSNSTDLWVSLKEYSFPAVIPANGYVTSTVTGTVPKPIITFDLNAVDGTVGENERYLTKSNTWATIASIPGTYTWSITGDNGTSSTVTSGNTVDIAGGTNITTAADLNDTVTIDLDDSITLAGTLTVNGTGQSSFAGQVTVPTTPVASTDAASKDYVDNAVIGGLVYQGGYNAATNTPDLTTSPNSIEKGWTYTVTVDGTFFGEQLRVGDVLIAEVDDPSALDDWTTVQNNIDLASLTQVGIGNVNAEPAGNLGGIAVAYNAGTAKVGLGIAALGVDPLTETPADYFIPIYNAADDENTKVASSDLLNAINSATSYATTITDTATVTHNLGTKDVIIQLFDTSNAETVYADVARASVNTATITFATTPTNSIRVLVQKIG